MVYFGISWFGRRRWTGRFQTHTGTGVSVLFIDKGNEKQESVLMDASKPGEKIREGKNLAFTVTIDNVCSPVVVGMKARA